MEKDDVLSLYLLLTPHRNHVKETVTQLGLFFVVVVHAHSALSDPHLLLHGSRHDRYLVRN
jgi:hypothetical protein